MDLVGEDQAGLSEQERQAPKGGREPHVGRPERLHSSTADSLSSASVPGDLPSLGGWPCGRCLLKVL
jgi:hypothetical protein